MSTCLAPSPVAEVAYTTLDSPLGSLFVAVTGGGRLVRVAFVDDAEHVVAADVAEQLGARLVRRPDRLDAVRRAFERYFSGRLRAFPLALDWRLTGAFARRVLEYTATIPYGETSTYAEVAGAIGNPGAARAVGNALGSNPLPVVVPCHRVVRSDGGLGGYGGHPGRKAFLLGLESTPTGRRRATSR